ncbi:hypothetical protein B0H10DRAFT_1966587 [Mycena sp. CBHHK59/15]|nr:hypothetical protein B0H10DRAFT_1966587 [Mycena sp. CBHHK59/15]
MPHFRYPVQASMSLNTLAAPIDPPTIQNSLQCMGIVRVEERKFSRKKIPFKFWYSGVPAMEDSPETGDLAQVAEGRFRVFDQTGEWVPVVAGAMHPYPPLRKYKFGGDDSGWISPRTYQIDQKMWRENSKTPSRPNKKLKTKIPEIVMLRKNEWLDDLTETWGGSPFIYII